MPFPVYEYLVEVTLRIDGSGTEQVFYFSTHGRTTGPAETPAATHYMPRIIQPGVIQLDLYQSGTTRGRTRYGFGAIVLANTDGGLDAMQDYGYAGQPITVLMGQQGAARSTFEVVFTGTMDQPSFAWDKLALRVRDRQYELAQANLCSVAYLGTNTGAPLAGIEGTASDIKGRMQPLVYGKVSNVPVDLVNADRYIFRISELALNSVDAVYDSGKALTAGAAYSSQSDMETNAPTAGQYRAWLAGGCIRVGTKPVGTLTVDATQGSSSSARTAAQLLHLLAQRAGMAPTDINAADVIDLDAAAGYELGVRAEQDDATLTVMDRVAASVGAWYGYDLDGVMRLGRLIAPAGTPVLSLTSTTILAIERLATSDPGGGVPTWRVRLSYWPAQLVQSGSLDATVSTARREYLEAGALFAVAEDSSVLLQHPAAATMTVSTLLTTASDAATEAARLLALYQVRRDRLRVTTFADPTTAAKLRLGSVVEITLPRYDLVSGKSFVLTGLLADFSRNTVTLDLWG